MKKSLFLLAIIAIVSLFTVSCDVTESHVHSYGEWYIKVAPTMNEGGLAERVCTINGCQDGFPLPALTDEVFWTKTVTPVSCVEDGVTTYTSQYGSVSVDVIPMFNHKDTTWTLTVEPTLSVVGAAHGVCVCGEEFDVEVPALTDDSVWTKNTVTTVSCTVEGLDVYTSIYGEVEVVTPRTSHTPSSWALSVTPTLVETGKAIGKCTCGELVEVEVAVLSDDTVWTVVSEVAPDYNNAGSRVYSSIYGGVTLPLAKLVAPYDNKTYYSVALDAENDDNAEFTDGLLSITTSWDQASITLDENGEGIGTAYPFRGKYKISMVDAETGEILITVYDCTFAEGQEPVVDYEKYSTYKAFVNFETGMIIRAYNSNFRYVHIMTPDTKVMELYPNIFPFGVPGFGSAVILENGSPSDGFIVTSDNVLFGCEFVNNPDLIDDCSYVSISHNGEFLCTIAGVIDYPNFNFFVTDNYEGVYSNGTDKLNLNGIGTAHYITNEVDVYGPYTISEEDPNVVELLLGDADKTYYVATVNLEDDTFTIVKPMITVSYNAGTLATVDATTVNPYKEITLPTPTNVAYAFKGWFVDEECTTPVTLTEDNTFVAPKEDVTLFALWKALVIINLVDVLEGDATVLYLGEGDVIGQELPKYNIDFDTMKIFKGWYLDQEYSNSLPEDVQITEDDTNITIYAKWEVLPEYYGTYYGANIYGETSGGSSASKTLSINEKGEVEVSGSKKGTVVEYNKDTQVITYSNSSGSNEYIYFNAEAGVAIMNYSGYNNLANGIKDDINFYAKEFTSTSKIVHYGFYNLDLMKSNYNRVVVVGDKIIFINNQSITADVTLTNTSGSTLVVSSSEDNSIAKSKTLIIKDKDGKTLLGLAATGASFKDSKTSVVSLDPYYGTYIVNGSPVVLDGAGAITAMGMTGTYTIVSGKDYLFDIYLNNGAMYIQANLVEGVVTFVQPMVTVSFNVGEHAAVEPISVNMNTVATLPEASDEGFVFNGWFLDEEYNTPVPAEFKPAADTVLYGKYSAPAVLTINYCDEVSENTTLTYSVGDLTKVENPLREGYLFVNWFTTSDYETDTVWVNTNIMEDTTIYALWEVAPAYVGSSYAISAEGTSANGGVSNLSRSVAINVNTKLEGTGSTYPLSPSFTIIDRNDANNTFTVSKSSYKYSAVYSETENIVVMCMTYSGSDFKEVLIWGLNETSAINSSKISSSYWNSGNQRLISYTDQDDNTHTIFINNTVVYFRATATDGFGNPVEFKDAYKQQGLIVSAGGETFCYANDGTKLVSVTKDELAGIYAENVVVDGLGNISVNGVTGKYVAQDNLLKVTTDTEYLEITLDKDSMTASIVKPMVTITLTPGVESTVENETISVNKNFECVLPQVTVTNPLYEFVGWFTDSSFTTAISEGKLVPQEDMVVYAYVREVPVGLAKNNPYVVDFTDTNEVVITGATTVQDHLNYYFKVTLASDDRVYFKTDNIKHVGSTSGSGYMYTSYARFNILNEDGSSFKSAVSFGSNYNNSYFDLPAGTYYFECDLGAYSTTRDAWGTFDALFAVSSHDSVATAVELTAGNSYTLENIDRTYVFIKIALEAGKTYKLTGSGSPSIYVDQTMTTKYTKSSIYYTQTTITIAPTENVTYYIAAYTAGTVFTLVEA